MVEKKMGRRLDCSDDISDDFYMRKFLDKTELEIYAQICWIYPLQFSNKLDEFESLFVVPVSDGCIDKLRNLEKLQKLCIARLCQIIHFPVMRDRRHLVVESVTKFLC